MDAVNYAFLDVVSEICRRINVSSLDRNLEACRSFLNQDRLIDVAVVGQFKAGKSSFLNSLLGRDILPVGVVPVTTVVTRLIYGEKERVKVLHQDGREVEISVAEIVNFVAENNNPHNEKKVEIVTIELPDLKEYRGLSFVDTPGLGSIYKDHERSAENWFPEVGAAILCVSAERPLGESDLELLRKIQEYTPKIIILLTKIDLLSHAEQQEVRHFLESYLRRAFFESLPVYLYSTRSNTEQRRQLLKEEILDPLIGNRQKVAAGILRHKFISLGTACLRYLTIALDSARREAQELETCRRQILDEKVNYENFREEMVFVTLDIKQKTRPQLNEYLEKFYAAKLKEKVTAELRHVLPTWQGNLWQLTRLYEAWLKETLSRELHLISHAGREEFLANLRKAQGLFSRRLETFRTLLNQNVEKVLGIKLPDVDWRIEVKLPAAPDVWTIRTFDQHLDSLWFLIPLFIFRPLVEKHFLRQIPKAVTVNLSRLAAQWEVRVNRAIDTMMEQTLKYVHDEITALDTLLSSRSHSEEDLFPLKEKLTTALKGLEDSFQDSTLDYSR